MMETLASIPYPILWTAAVTATAAFLLGLIKFSMMLGGWMASSKNNRFAALFGIEPVATDMRSLNIKFDEVLDMLNTDTLSRQGHARGVSDPRTLSARGRKISREMDARSLALTLARELPDRTDGMNEYDVQNFCLEYVRYEYVPAAEIEKRMKGIAYDNNITMHSVQAVLAFELRDALLQSRNAGARG